MTDSRPRAKSERCVLVGRADPDLLTSMRLFVASVARLWGRDEDDVDDLRLAVSELAAAAVTAGAEDVTVTVDRPSAGLLRITVEPLHAADLEAGPVAAADVVSALFDRVVVTDGRVVITVSDRR